MVMRLDPWVIVPILVSCVIMTRWAVAYYIFPAALARALKDIPLGPFETHMIGLASFVRYCGHSHLIMAIRDIAMLAMMYHGYYEICVGVLIVTLLPLAYGGEFSMTCAKFLRREAPAMNQFIESAQKAIPLDE